MKNPLEEQCEAAMKLLGASPPRRSQIDLRNIMLLRGSSASTEEDDLFVSSILSTADQQLKPVRCPQCPAAAPFTSIRFSIKQYGWFIPCEYNRDADFFRCPWCNAYAVAKEELKTVDSSKLYVPSAAVRELEELGNAMFAEYAQLYYGDTSVASCYFWEDPGSSSGEDPALGIAVVISHRKAKSVAQPMAAESSGAEAGGFAGATWSSTHVVSATPSPGGEYTYNMVSSIFLDVTDSTMSSARVTVRYGGFASHASKPFTARRATAGISGKPIPHVSPVGHQIQKVENRLREVVAEVYFKKMGQLLVPARVSSWEGSAMPDARPHRMLTAVDQPAVAKATPAVSAAPAADVSVLPPPVVFPGAIAASSESVTAVDETKKDAAVERSKKKSKRRAVRWEAAQDEEGNTYYYNPKTMETTWEKPPGEEDAAAISGAVEVGFENVLEVLRSLSLSGGEPEEVERVLRKQLKVKSVARLLALNDLEEGAEQALAAAIPTFGDRRKIAKWIRKNQNLRPE